MKINHIVLTLTLEVLKCTVGRPVCTHQDQSRPSLYHLTLNVKILLKTIMVNIHTNSSL